MKTIRKLIKFSLFLIILSMVSIGLIKAESPAKVFVALGYTWHNQCATSLYFISLDEKDVHYCPGYSFVGELGIAHFNQLLRMVVFNGGEYSQNFYAIPGTEVLVTVNCNDFMSTTEVFARVYGSHHIASVGPEESVCLSENESYNLTIEIIEPHPNAEGFLEITTDPLDISAEKVILDLPNQPFLYNIDLYDIIVSKDWWDRTLYITAKSKLKFTECEIIDTTYVRTFTKQIPPATAEPVIRTACTTDQIVIIADQSVADNYENYVFTLHTSDHQSSNQYPLNVGEVRDGNKIVLILPNPVIEAGIYDIQIGWDSGINPGLGAKCAYTIEGIVIPDKPLPFQIANIFPTDLRCYNDNSGIFELEVEGGRQPFFISHDGNTWVEGVLLTGRSAGHQPIYVKDADNCLIETDDTLYQPDLLVSTIDSLVNPDCFGDATGELHVSTTGGTNPYQISKDSINWTSATSLTNLTAGDYIVYVRDNKECTAKTAASITQPSEISVDPTPISPMCYGFNDGSISLNVNGGSGGYQYLWNTGATTSQIENLVKGDYQVTVTDSKGCNKTTSYALNEPELITIIINDSIPTCHDSADGSLLATVSGGSSLSGTYNYLWSTGDTTKELKGLGQGNYAVEVTDDRGCKGNESEFLQAPPPPSPDWETNSADLCEGNTITLDGGEFTEYRWYTTQGTLSNQRYLTVGLGGTYFLDITDDKGCKGTDSFVITLLESPIEAELLLADSARVNEIISVIDVTWPVPDSLEWYFDKPVELHMQNDWSAYFSSSETGLLHVTLRAWYAGCFSDSTKTVYIFDDGTKSKEFLPEKEFLIREYHLYPNPSQGYFTVEVRLSRQSDILLNLYSASTSVAISSKKYYGEENYKIEYQQPGLKPGIYLLVLQAGNERKVMRIVVN